MSAIDRKFMAHYINSEEPAATQTYVWNRLGQDLEELKVELNAEVETKNNILGETSKRVSSYQAQQSVEPYYCSEGDAMFTRLQGIIDSRKTLDDLKTAVCEVHLWDETATEGTYNAYREDAIIEIASYGGDKNGYQIAYNVHMIGNRVAGTFVLSTKTFTATA